MTEIRKKYDEHRRYQISFAEDTGRTQQSFREEANINNIMRKWNATGKIDHLAQGKPKYGDFSTVYDYKTAQDAINESNATFADLPAEIREKMGYSPAELLRFLDNEDNYEEALELGLVNKRPTTEGESPPETPPDEGEASSSP